MTQIFARYILGPLLAGTSLLSRRSLRLPCLSTRSVPGCRLVSGRAFLQGCTVVLLGWLLAGETLAQQSPGLTVELIDTRIETLRGNGVAEGDQTLTLYEEARALLAQEESFRRDAAAFEEALTTAPVRESEIQQRLDNLDVEFDPAAELQDLAPAEVQTRLSQLRTEEREISSQLEALDRRLAARETNATTARERLTQIDTRMAELQGDSPSVNPEGVPSLLESQQWRELAEERSLSAESLARRAQLESQPVRFSALAAERAELALNRDRLVALIRELETRVTGSVQEATGLEELGIDTDSPVYGLASELVNLDTQLSTEQVAMNGRLAEVRQINERINSRTQALEERFNTARRIVSFGSDSESLGRVLLTYWEELDSFTVASPTEQLSSEIGNAVIRRIDLEERLATLVSASAYLNGQLQQRGIEPASMATDTRQTILQLIRNYRDRLRTVIEEISLFIDESTQLETGYNTLNQRREVYQDFLQGQILWIPNRAPMWTMLPGEVIAELDSFPTLFYGVEMTLSPWSLLALLAAFVLIFYRKRLKNFQLSLNSRIARPRDDSIVHTVYSTGAALLRALPRPLLALALAAAFAGSDLPQTQTVFDLLMNLVPLLFVLSLLRIVAERSGLGSVHFNWNANAMAMVHRILGFTLNWWLPLALVAALVSELNGGDDQEFIGRLALLGVLLIMAVRLHQASSRGKVEAHEQASSSWVRRLRMLLLVAFMVAFAAIVYGQVYTVKAIVGALIQMISAGIVLLLVHAVIMRSLRVARRKLRFRELLTQRSQQQASGDESGELPEENTAQLVDISSDTQQLVNVTTIALAFVFTVLIWEPLLPALDALEGFALWSSSTEVDGETIVTQITLATVITVILLASLTLFAAKRLPALVEITLRSRTRVSAGSRYTVSTLMNYVIIGVGVIMGLSALGLQWSQLQWLVAALGVGIGFGLQEIVANFISGLIILFEHPIRVGDVVTVGGKDGVVTKIRIRATTIRDWDGKELLVPNKEFITQHLLNWTLSDSQNRVVIAVGVAYGSDVEKAISLLYKVIDDHPDILTEPAPRIVFEHFGDNSLELTARFFVADIEHRLTVITAVRIAINRAFEEAGIVIAFPQRDVHMDIVAPVRVVLEGSSADRSGRDRDDHDSVPLVDQVVQESPKEVAEQDDDADAREVQNLDK